MATSVTARRWIGQQRKPVSLHPAPDTLRIEAASVVASMSDTIPTGDTRYAWSRAKSGCTSNPLYRIVLFFRALRSMGGTYADAWLALAWLIGKVDGLWADAALSEQEAHEAEIRADADECVAQYRAIAEPAARRMYREKLIRQLATGHQLLAAMDATDARRQSA